jgi:hypothetical protein
LGWVEDEFIETVIAYAIFYGGVCQILVGIFELFKGATFSFAVFGSYGAFWLGWALIHLYRKQADGSGETIFQGGYRDGEVLWLIQWGFLSFFFWIVSFRKNMCLIVTLGYLHITFFLLAATRASGKESVTKAAGAFGFVTALGALYTAAAEILNEELGRHVLPGLKPMIAPERFKISAESIQKRTSFDKSNKTMFIQFRGMHILTKEDVEAIRNGVENAFGATGEEKAHVVVDYDDVVIADDILQLYWQMVAELEKKYYLSAKRFHVTSFGTGSKAISDLSIRTKVTDMQPRGNVEQVKI